MTSGIGDRNKIRDPRLARRPRRHPQRLDYADHQDRPTRFRSGKRPRYEQPKTQNRKELLEAFDKLTAEARAAIAGVSDEALMKPWTLLMGGQVLFTMPRAAVLRSFCFNHLIHHRAQLTMYLRALDIPVPALYGPSADEQG